MTTRVAYPIDGKETKLKVSNDVIEQLDLFFPGKTFQDRIRECVNYGIKYKESQKILSTDKDINVVDLFSGAGGLSRRFMDVGVNVRLGIYFDGAPLREFVLCST